MTFNQSSEAFQNKSFFFSSSKTFKYVVEPFWYKISGVLEYASNYVHHNWF